MSKTFYGSYNVINPNLSYNNTNQTVTNPLSENLDAGNFEIINLANPSDPQDAVNLRYLQSAIPDISDFVENPLTESLNAGNFTISNLANPVNNQDAVNKQYLQSVVPDVSDFIENPLTAPLNANNNIVSNVQSLAFFNGHTLDVDVNQNLLYNDNIVVDSANIGGYISAGNWEPLASSNLNMNQYDINLTSGKIYLGNNYGLAGDISNNLNYGGEKVMIQPTDIYNSLTLTNYTPEQSDYITVIGGLPVAGTTTAFQFSDVNYLNPLLDIYMEFQVTDNNINLSTAFLIIGISPALNPINTPSDQEYLKIMGNSFVFNSSTNKYSCRFRNKDVNQYITILTPWTTCLTNITANGGETQSFMYMSLYGAVSTGFSGCSMTYFNGIINVLGNTTNNNYFLNINKNLETNGLIPFNNNTSLYQSYQGALNVPLVNGVNILYKIVLPEPVSQQMQTLYIRATIVSNKYVLKMSCLYQNGAIVENSVTDQLIYEIGTVFEGYQFILNNDNTIDIQNTLNTQDNYNNTSIKVKIINADE
jgi:hypothetical protein